MIVLLSPAKSLDFESPNAVESYSVPDFLEETDTLIARCRKLSHGEHTLGHAQPSLPLPGLPFHSPRTPLPLPLPLCPAAAEGKHGIPGHPR